MVNSSEFDLTIKNALIVKANEINTTDDMLDKILSKIQTKQTQKKFLTTFRKVAAAVACSFVILLGSTLIVSAEARSIVINTIKTIFVFDDNGDIIEQPANVLLNPSLCKDTQLNDSQISKKLNVDITYPQTILDSYNLESKYEAVGFSKSISYETFNKIQSNVEKAISDNQAFIDLKEYNPYRSIGGLYKNADNKGVFISVFNKKMFFDKNTKTSRIVEISKTKVKNYEALWIGIKYIEDISVRSDKIKIQYALFFTKNNISYGIVSVDGEIKKEYSVKIAENFIAAQK